MAVTFPEIETALAAVWTGATITTLDQGAGTSVEVFVDIPDPEEFPDRVYPSISIMFASMTPEASNFDSTEDEEVDVDTGSVPYVITTRRSSEWYRVVYHVSSWALDAAADRELVRWVESRLKPRDSIQIGSEYYWIFRAGFRAVDEQLPDRVIYHKVWTFEVLADIDNADTDEQEKAVHEIRLTTGLVETRLSNAEYAELGRDELLEQGYPALLSQRYKPRPVDASGNPVDAADAVFHTHRTIAFDDTDFTIIDP